MRSLKMISRIGKSTTNQHLLLMMQEREPSPSSGPITRLPKYLLKKMEEKEREEDDEFGNVLNSYVNGGINSGNQGTPHNNPRGAKSF